MRETHHQIILESAAHMAQVADQSIDLVVTSPPYPMIQMWDDLFGTFDPGIAEALALEHADDAFEKMHGLLDSVWEELRRVIKPGGMACINIGDAVRFAGGQFRLFANHARIIAAFQSLGFTQLPAILWRKPTNAPNKFMGSGMLPPSAYVTLEHEYILIFRRCGKRPFLSPEAKQARRESAYFWEERNTWFSDVWLNLIGATQHLSKGMSRERSAAFPLEIPYRLINMFALKGDTVLDPFLGTGTTMLAAMASARNCVGFEVDPAFQTIILQKAAALPQIANHIIEQRLKAHADFIRDRMQAEKDVRNFNRPYQMPVVTRQEEDLFFDPVAHIQFIGNDRFKVIYGTAGVNLSTDELSLLSAQEKLRSKIKPKSRQLKLF
jgi:modification methylase